MTKRTRSDSLKGKMQAIVNAFQDTIEPPAHAGLMPEAIDFYNDNIRTKALNLWTPSDLIEVVSLANNQYALMAVSHYLRKLESDYAETRDEKAIKENRKYKLELTRVIIAQRSGLQIHSRATNGESRDQRNKNQNDAEARRVRNDMEDDDLLAPPVH
ncbi:terminase [Xenorhabdus sp. XENO-10]|uniref:Terminase n=1 Tax=Xenorhabdus yunnanensis TaxID=3025878 RepID=A0ABT5LKU0_9GAMM|nr:terminase [Xenorhabdus yunnanensis]MDC9591076.1 terminase [Xenorhabdus yunnanensis]